MKQILLIIAAATLMFSCQKEQYKGTHISEQKQKQLNDHHNNYHVKETFKALEKTECDKEKREKQSVKTWQTQMKVLVKDEKTRTYRRTKSLEFDFY